MNYLRTDYSLDLDHSQTLLQPSPSSSVFEVCQILAKDSTLLVTFLVTIYHEELCVLPKQAVNKKAEYGVSLSSRKWNSCNALCLLCENYTSNFLVCFWKFFVDFYSQLFLHFLLKSSALLEGNEDC